MLRIFTPAVRRFLRYIMLGGATFAFDLLILWASVEFLGIPYYIATFICFPIAVSVNYVLSRFHVFRGTKRRFETGYAYFLLVAFAGAFITTGGVAFLVTTLALHYLVARVLVACMVGTLNYLIHLHLNFRVAGHHV